MIFSPYTEDQNFNCVDPQLAENLCKQFSAILFRIFDFSVDNFLELTSTYCTYANKNFSAGRRTVDDTKNIQTVGPGNNTFPFYLEMSREPWRPDVFFRL